MSYHLEHSEAPTATRARASKHQIKLSSSHYSTSTSRRQQHLSQDTTNLSSRIASDPVSTLLQPQPLKTTSTKLRTIVNFNISLQAPCELPLSRVHPIRANLFAH